MLQFLELSAAEVGPGIRSVDLLGESSYNPGAGRVDKPLKLCEMVVEEMTGLRTLARSANQYGAFNRRIERNQFARDSCSSGKR